MNDFLDPDLLPVGGVALALFARVSRELTAFRYDPNEAVRIAERHGVDREDWIRASRVWGQRIRDNPAIAERFRAAFETL